MYQSFQDFNHTKYIVTNSYSTTTKTLIISQSSNLCQNNLDPDSANPLSPVISYGMSHTTLNANNLRFIIENKTYPEKNGGRLSDLRVFGTKHQDFSNGTLSWERSESQVSKSCLTNAALKRSKSCETSVSFGSIVCNSLGFSS
jgi:hypothetical protein